MTVFSRVSSVWNGAASSLGLIVRGFGCGHTHATALILVSSFSAPWVCIQNTWLILCKICPVKSSLLLPTAVFHTPVISDTILNPVNWCCLCWKARKQLPLLPYPIAVPDHTKQLVWKNLLPEFRQCHISSALYGYFFVLFCTLGDCWQQWKGGCTSTGTRVENSLFLQAGLPAKAVRTTNKLLFINRVFSNIYETM